MPSSAKKQTHQYEIKDFKWLVRTIFRGVMESGSRRVWILGAGASVDSGIAGGVELAHRWSCKLTGKPAPTPWSNSPDFWKIDLKEKTENLKAWREVVDLQQHDKQIGDILGTKDENIRYRMINDFLGECYFEVYDSCFKAQPSVGYEELRKEMGNKLPSTGYYTLASLMSKRSNLVITVNFDNLIANALFLSTGKFPIILDHENVAHLANIMDDYPLVCKVHRDLLKRPLSAQNDTNHLEESWKKTLQNIFQYYSPLFIGYGANDQSLMAYLESVDAFPEPPIWLFYTKAANHDDIRKEVPEPITSFLSKHRESVLVPITGFDKLMHNARAELADIGDIVEQVESRNSVIVTNLREQQEVLDKEYVDDRTTDPIVKSTIKTISDKPSKSVSQWLSLVRSQKNLKTQIRLLNQALKEHKHADLYHMRGFVRNELKQHEAAIVDCDRAIELNPKSSMTYNNRGFANDRLTRYAAAIADYDRAIEIDPNYATAYTNRGIAKASLKQYEAAIADYDRAIEIDPTNTRAYNSRGFAKDSLTRYAAAIDDYDRAIEIDPNFAAPYNNRGFAKTNLKQYETAIADYDRAIEIDPNYATAYTNRGIAKRNLKQYEAAIADYDRAIEIDPTNTRAYNNRGFAKRHLKRYEAAIADYDRAIEIDSKYVTAYRNRAMAKRALGLIQDAEKDEQMVASLENGANDS